MYSLALDLFASLKRHAEKHCWLICYEKKNIVPWLIRQADKFKRTGSGACSIQQCIRPGLFLILGYFGGCVQQPAGEPLLCHRINSANHRPVVKKTIDR